MVRERYIEDFSIVPEDIRDRVREMYENRYRVSELRSEAADLDRRFRRVAYGTTDRDPLGYIDEDYDQEILGWLIGANSTKLRNLQKGRE